MFKLFKKQAVQEHTPTVHARRLEQMKSNPWKRVDSENMTDVEKMDEGFNGKTYSINGMDVDF